MRIEINKDDEEHLGFLKMKGRGSVRKSIKKKVLIRVAAAVGSVVLMGVIVLASIIGIQSTQKDSVAANELLDRALRAEVAHYKWSANLSSALYAGTEFTGSKDPTGCVLGQWLYGEAGTEDAQILGLRGQLEPLHRQLLISASDVLATYAENPAAAQQYYRESIQANLTTLVGLLDNVIERTRELSEQAAAETQQLLTVLEGLTLVFCLLVLLCLGSLVQYVLKRVVRPILRITRDIRPMQEGRLELQLAYHEDDELGDLAKTLEGSLTVIRSCVEDINRIMDQLSGGSFAVRTQADFIGDFSSIERSIDSFTTAMSASLGHINSAENQISANAEQLSSGAQALAQGATEQASSVEELFAQLDELSRAAAKNVDTARNAQRSATQASEHVMKSSTQMEEMVTAMHDITAASHKISEIIGTIENIAFRTNILALNAAVEATRAGTAGKGFAVVAGEVRSLAGQSDKAAKATRELISNSVQATERGNHIVKDVSTTLGSTMELVVRANQEIGGIAEAVQSEAAAIAQVTEGVSQISAVVQANSASSEESAAVSTELFEQVRLLENQTKQFKLKS